jgi:hypothetical protein
MTAPVEGSALLCRICQAPIVGMMPMVCSPLAFDAVSSTFPVCDNGHVDLRKPQTLGRMRAVAITRPGSEAK